MKQRFDGKETPGVAIWTIAVVLSVLMLLSGSLTAGRKSPLPPMGQAAEYVKWSIPSPAAGGAPAHPRRTYAVVPVADFPVEPTYYGFDLPEGIAISPRGNIYAGMNVSGQIFKIDREGAVSEIADFVEQCDDGFILGLAVDKEERVFVCVWGFNLPELNALWRIDPDGTKTRVYQFPDGGWTCIPNAMAFDLNGNLFITDSGAGSIWRLGQDGEMEVWKHDPLLLGDYFGANGIAYRNRALWVLNYDRGRIVRVPIERDGSPGQAETFAESPLLLGCDGCQFDVLGNLYVCVMAQNQLVRVNRLGEAEVLVSAGEFNGFTMPINPVFGFGRERSMIFLSGLNPHIVKIDVGIPGMLLAQFISRGHGTEAANREEE